MLHRFVVIMDQWIGAAGIWMSSTHLEQKEKPPSKALLLWWKYVSRQCFKYSFLVFVWVGWQEAGCFLYLFNGGSPAKAITLLNRIYVHNRNGFMQNSHDMLLGIKMIKFCESLWSISYCVVYSFVHIAAYFLKSVQPLLKPFLYLCFRVPTAAEVDKWKESFSHMMSSESKCYIIVSHLKRSSTWTRTKLMMLVFEQTHTNNTDTKCQADAWLISSPAESLSGVYEKKKPLKTKHDHSHVARWCCNHGNIILY